MIPESKQQAVKRALLSAFGTDERESISLLTGGLSSASGGYGTRKYVGPFACRNEIVKLKGFDASLLICVRSYRKLDGLYDFTVRVTSLNQSHRGFASHLDMHGMDYDAAMRFVRRYVEAMQWEPS